MAHGTAMGCGMGLDSGKIWETDFSFIIFLQFATL